MVQVKLIFYASVILVDSRHRCLNLAIIPLLKKLRQLRTYFYYFIFCYSQFFFCAVGLSEDDLSL